MAFTYMPFMAYADTDVSDNDTIDTLMFTADIHNQKKDNGAKRLQSMIDYIAVGEKDKIDVVGTNGDTGSAYAENSSVFWNEVQSVLDVISESNYVKKDISNIGSVNIAGNHEWDNGNMAKVDNSTTKQFERKVGRFIESKYYNIYCFGAVSKAWEYTDENISKLDNFLANYDSDKPLFIMSHYPLHSIPVLSETKNGTKVIDTINKYAEDKTIIYLWGHNHTLTDHDSYYDKVHTSGDKVANKTIKFVYAAAGCMSDGEDYFFSDQTIMAKALVASIDTVTGETTLKYYRKDGSSFGDTIVKKGVKKNPTFKISAKQYYYDGKNHAPAVSVISRGYIGAEPIVETGKLPDIYKISVPESDRYTSGEASYKIVVKPTSIKSLKKYKKAFKVTVNKQASNYVTGYQVRYSLKKNMSASRIKTISKNYKAVSKKITKLKKKKTYYVQVRTFKKIGSNNYYSNWSKTRAIKTK